MGLVAAWLLLGMAVAMFPVLDMAWYAMGALVGVAAVADAFFALGPSALELTRRVSGSLPIGVSSEVTLRIVNRTARALVLELHDHHPARARIDGLP